MYVLGWKYYIIFFSINLIKLKKFNKKSQTSYNMEQKERVPIIL